MEGITAIVDLNQDPAERDAAERIGLKYCADPRLGIKNNYRPIKVDVLDYVTNTIARLISEGRYVYLHCTASQGRSPTVAAAYLIRLGKTKDEAMKEVRTVRPMAWYGGDRNYAEDLNEFEEECRKRKIT